RQGNYHQKTMSPSLKWKLVLLNIGGILYFFALSLGSLVIGLLITLPDLYADDPQALFRRRAVGVYVFIILLLNWVCLVYYHKHSRLTSASSLLPKFTAGQGMNEHRSCYDCSIVCPPRTKHCPLCEACVIKRDHHCFFGGCCVGFHNQRYFIVFCFYGAIGALYSTILTFTHLTNHYANPLSYEIYCYLLPWLLYYWVIGQIQMKTVAMVLFGYFCLMTFLACGFYFGFQCFLLTTGQTFHEWTKGNKRYRQPLLDNLRSVFGPWWLLNFIIPMPFLKSPDNGLDWRIAHEE
ncbi:hypothetical protein BaRGS_00019751, partial [Batillaria attramentaria]